MANKVCDFCLDDYDGVFGGPKKLADGHLMCRNCRKIIESYGLPLKYELFQTLVTAQANMRDMIMDAYLETNKPDDCLEHYYPAGSMTMHEGEHLISAIPATITVDKTMLPQDAPVKTIAEVMKNTIHNIPDTNTRSGAMKVSGTLYETEAAVYFISDHFINCHKLGYVKRNRNETDRILVITPKRQFTYTVEHADLFFLRERFYQKVNAAKHNKRQHLIYINNDNDVTVTPGVYDIPKILKPGIYRVKAIKDAGLHVRDSFGRVKDYYESEELIDLAEGGILECTGEYELEWVSERPAD